MGACSWIQFKMVSLIQTEYERNGLPF